MKYDPIKYRIINLKMLSDELKFHESQKYSSSESKFIVSSFNASGIAQDIDNKMVENIKNEASSRYTR